MASIVITLLGDDRAGLVDAVAGVVSGHQGNWEQSHLAELAGKFAGIVLVTVPEAQTDTLLRALDDLHTKGLLAITAERAMGDVDPANIRRFALGLIGQDHAGIVHEVSRVLAERGVSIEQLETGVTPAPQGGNLFTAHAVLEVPADVASDELRSSLEAVTHDLMVDLDPIE